MRVLQEKARRYDDDRRGSKLASNEARVFANESRAERFRRRRT